IYAFLFCNFKHFYFAINMIASLKPLPSLKSLLNFWLTPLLSRRIKALFVLSFCGVFLTGCGQTHTRNDIIDYVKVVWGLTAFKVCLQPKESVGKDGYTDYEWTVTEKDGSQFVVVDDYYYGQEWVTHKLRDNRNYLRTKQYLQSADCTGFQTEDTQNGSMGGIALICTFTNRQELLQGIRRMNILAAGCPAGLTMFFDMHYAHEYRSIGAYSSKSGNTHYVLKSGERAEAAPSEANMLGVIIDMRYDRAMREFSETEILALVKGNRNSFGVQQPDGSYKVYDDLLLDGNGYGMSFPTLYEVLKRSGYAVSGTKERYAFKGIDGHTYEFSNDFQENNSYYYIRDGQHVPMEHYFHNHWGFYKIKQMTGLQCVYYKDTQKRKEKNHNKDIVPLS
ncbi:MAG: hypothetical protein Q4F00_03395, partial [bacterium]|nr:hypothetical protein [bacterium]